MRRTATWFQFNDAIGTTELGEGHSHPKGFGNWRDNTAPNTWSWSSALPQDPPQTVRFGQTGMQRLRVQLRHSPHVIDQIWLSATQRTRPTTSEPVAKPDDQGDLTRIVLDAADAKTIRGRLRRIDDQSASTGRVLEIGGAALVEIYPAHTEIGRVTKGVSEFTVQVRPDNYGVLLRRTLDYQYPNQRAEVYVADADDDEFLISSTLTRGRSAVRGRVRFTPVEIPLLPDRDCGDLA